jgi:hypothetical protein
LIRIILLRIAGYSREASELETQIIDSLSIPSDISSKWQHLKISKLIEFKNLNPFVLYPFFIYYENS